MFESLTIRVPATSANLGPGFDTLGIALSLYNEFVFTLAEKDGVSGCKAEYCGVDNLTLRSFRIAASAIGAVCPGVQIEHRANIPDTRGLGSSSTCIVAGVVAAFAIIGQLDDKQHILELATAIEGHPDNVAPAIFGGLTVSILENGITKALPIPMAHAYHFIALIPPFQLSTCESRAVLPQSVARQDAVTNISHVAMLLAAMVHGDDQMLKLVLQDKLHQPYRGKLIPAYDDIMGALNNDSNILGAYLSGAGPTIMALSSEDGAMEKIKLLLGDWIDGWDVKQLEIAEEGFVCEII